MTYQIVELAQGIVQFKHDGPAYSWQFNSGLQGLSINGGGAVALNPVGHYVSGGTGVPTATGVGATNSTAAALNTGNDTAGSFYFSTIGGGTAVGNQACLIFALPYATTPQTVLLQANNTAAASLSCWVVASTTSFTLFTKQAPGTSATHGFNYLVIG